MSPIVIDASVLVSAADLSDRFHAASRDCLHAVVRDGFAVLLPSLAGLETAAALARRIGDGGKALALTARLFEILNVREVAMDDGLLRIAREQATSRFLRGADSLYAAVAREHAAPLIAWDRELVGRAGALSPTDWLASR